MGDMFGLPIETGSFRVQSYKNFLANIGLLFIHNYLSNYKLSDVQPAVYVKRRPTEKTRKINELGLKLEDLKKKSLDLTTSQINLKTLIEKEEGGVEMQEQLKQQKAQAKAIEEQIEEVTSQINKLVGTSSVKVVAKKGLFKGGVKPKVSASSTEKVEEPVKSYYTETEVEKMLKEKLLMDIANRFPEGSDMYSVAEMIGAVPSSLTKDTLTVAMLKSGKFTGEKAKKDEIDMLDEFAAELEDEFGAMAVSEEGAKGAEADEAGYDEDLEDFNLMDEVENDDALGNEEDY
jgi:hypothetical protein